ncbi:MAG: hypothetical protein ACD_23C00842G0002 [uncultured bacterium]|nr:MAG: hypothetical protein ACD_23C00842G0002 [uncultured bacterium]
MVIHACDEYHIKCTNRFSCFIFLYKLDAEISLPCNIETCTRNIGADDYCVMERVLQERNIAPNAATVFKQATDRRLHLLAHDIHFIAREILFA